MATLNLNQILGQNLQADAATTPCWMVLSASKTLFFNKLFVTLSNYNPPLFQSVQK